MFFMVRANGATVQMRGVDLKGQPTQEMVTIPVDSTLYWNGPLITTYCVQDGYVYFIIGNHFFVYYPDGTAMEAKWMSGQGEAFDGIGGTDACQLVIQPQYGSLLQLTPRMEPDENGQTAGGTAFAVTGPHTVQLTLRGSAVVLLGLGGLALAAWLLFRKRKK